ncbi:MAG TPA: NepR family anti-sigma factor [Thermohalobaculum sp.]|nr:NepR family anti-sigma factor [Thermohalobaculum sp.]
MNSSRDGDEDQAAKARSVDTQKHRDDDTGKGVTRITEEQDPIAAALRRVYNDAATEPLPDDLSQLLSRLEAAEKDA